MVWNFGAERLINKAVINWLVIKLALPAAFVKKFTK
jgi:hypothetical protein